MATKTAKQGVTKKDVAKDDAAGKVIAMLTIEQTSRAINSSANANIKLNKFVTGEFSTPKIFKENNFKDYIKEVSKGIGVLNKSDLQAKLNQMIEAEVQSEVDNKVAVFKKLPLTADQVTKLDAAKETYYQHLTSLVASAKKMVREL